MSEQSYPTGGTGPSGPRASFGRRLVAAIVDGIILSIPYFILWAILGRDLAYALSLLVDIAYFTYLEGGPTGQTFGKKALDIRVIDFATGGPLGYGRGFIRWLLLDALGQGEADLALQARKLSGGADFGLSRQLMRNERHSRSVPEDDRRERKECLNESSLDHPDRDSRARAAGVLLPRALVRPS